jgi:hypothetical protein
MASTMQRDPRMTRDCRRYATLSLLFAACSSDGSGANVPIQDYPASYARVFCARIFECCAQSELDDRFPDWTDAAACEADVRADVQQDLDMAGPGLAEGRIVWDGDRAGRVIAAMDGAPCDEVLLRSSSNGPEILGYDEVDPLVGQVPIGTACQTNWDCVPGAWCALTGLVCEDVPGEGQACDVSCERGFDCSSDVCVPSRADGESCAGDDECAGGTCSFDVCTTPRTCDGP